MDVDGGGQQPRWAERWMASRASFDTNRSSIRGAAVPGRASMDHREPVKTLEMDTARPFSYSTPRRQAPSSSPMHHRGHSPVTPSPGKARPPIQVRSASPRVDRGGSYTPSLLHSQRHHHHQGGAAVPNYMAATESAKARVRSQSAPRQRLSVSSAAEAACPWERQPSGGRRRASLESQAQATPGAGGAAPKCGPVRVQRCPSQASAPGACPWGARLDRWSASAHDSECGSTSTVMTAATTTYCWSLATDNAGMA